MTLKEDAAAGSVSATAIAGVRAPIGGKVKRVVPMNKQKKPKKPIKESTFSAFLKEFAGDPTAVDVIGKLSANAKQSDDLDGDGVATYGLETDDGSIVKVLVAREQAKDFEQALSDELKDAQDNTAQDISELLFNLNDRFHIVDVVWPTIQEDEEEQDPNADPNGEVGMDDPSMDPNADPMADPNADPMADPSMDPNADPMADPMGGGDDGMDNVKSALDQIIDFLKSDAEARKADAEAKTAEARAREAEAAGKTAELKMAGEEEALDAESFFGKQKDVKKESDRLKMLAKYRQQTRPQAAPAAPSSEGGGASSAADEEEEVSSRMRKTLLRILRGR